MDVWPCIRIGTVTWSAARMAGIVLMHEVEAGGGCLWE